MERYVQYYVMICMYNNTYIIIGQIYIINAVRYV
jgi:hypothetical protein